MNYGSLVCNKKVVEMFSNSTSLAFGYLKLMVALLTTIFYTILAFQCKADSNYIIVLIFPIAIESVATTVFVTGYEGKKVIFLSWYNFSNYLLVIMKLGIGFTFVYYSKPMLVCPYIPLLFVDILLLFAMRKELKEHKKKDEVRFEFVNKLAGHQDIIRIMIPNKMVDDNDIRGAKITENKQEKKDSVISVETGTIAAESLDIDEINTWSTDMI